jgi:DNA-binding IclR family transcriptional regulator
VRLIDRRLEIVICLARIQPAGPRRVARRSGLPLTTVHRHLRALWADGFVMRGNWGQVSPLEGEYALTQNCIEALQELIVQLKEIS